MHAAVANASKRWLNRILMRMCKQKRVGIALCRHHSIGRQRGAMMLEAVAAVAAMGVVASSAIHFHTEAQQKALEAQVVMSASAFASALNMQQAAAALGKSTLEFNKNGFATGVHDHKTLTSQECEALWNTLLVSADAQVSNEFKADALPFEGVTVTRGWQMMGDGSHCIFTYREPSVGSKAFNYSAVTGRVTILPASSPNS